VYRKMRIALHVCIVMLVVSLFGHLSDTHYTHDVLWLGGYPEIPFHLPRLWLDITGAGLFAGLISWISGMKKSQFRFEADPYPWIIGGVLAATLTIYFFGLLVLPLMLLPLTVTLSVLSAKELRGNSQRNLGECGKAARMLDSAITGAAMVAGLRYGLFLGFILGTVTWALNQALRSSLEGENQGEVQTVQ